MNIEEAAKSIKKHIEEIYNKVINPVAPNVIRGHHRTISAEVEDEIGLFVSMIMRDDYLFILDPSIRVDGKTSRPDLLVADSNNIVKALIEIKTNMGWCRTADSVIDKLLEKDRKFKKEKILKCSFSSRDEKIQVEYPNNVKLFLVSFSDRNCDESLLHPFPKKQTSSN